MTSIIVTIETDAENAVKWAESKIEGGLTSLSELFMPFIAAAEPVVIADVKNAVAQFLTAAEAGGSLEDLEQDFLEALETGESTILAEAKSLAGPILQAIIALVKAA